MKDLRNIMFTKAKEKYKAEHKAGPAVQRAKVQKPKQVEMLM